MTHKTEALAALDYIEAQTAHLTTIPLTKFERIRAALSSQPPAPREVDAEAERIAFEAWAISEGFKVERGSRGLYTSLGTNQQFSGWLDRASLTATAGSTKP